MFIDTHCHLYDEYYDDINSLLKEWRNQGVKSFINNGCNQTTNEEVIDKIDRYDIMYGAIGIHPEHVDTYNKYNLLFIENNLNNSKIVAIGEIGLDYHYEEYDKEKQIELFETQLKLAQKYNIPVIIHSRDATQDTINILKKYKLTGVIHSFSGSVETAKEYIKLGFKLGINGVVTFKNAHIKEVIKEIGIDYFVLETDSPYLSPHPLRGTQNNPSNINIIINFLSDYLGLTKEEIIQKTNNNVKSVFQKLK